MISNDWKPVFFILSIANITYLLFGFTRVAVPQLGLDLPPKWMAVNQKQTPNQCKKIQLILTIDVPLIATGVDDILEITSASPIPAATPKSPPILVRIAASVKNCPRILPS